VVGFGVSVVGFELASAQSRDDQGANGAIDRTLPAQEVQPLIEQAKGILMERHAISADEAFAGLRNRARNTNMTVAAVAEAVITSHPLFRTTAPPSQNPG
jgi:AmiR/NasT family two-component response regulator